MKTEELNEKQRAWIAEKRKLDPIWRYVAGPPDSRGERPAHCPLHPDASPSMSINFREGVWACHAGCGGGSIRHLLDSRDAWVPEEEHPAFRAGSFPRSFRPARR